MPVLMCIALTSAVYLLCDMHLNRRAATVMGLAYVSYIVFCATQFWQ